MGVADRRCLVYVGANVVREDCKAILWGLGCLLSRRAEAHHVRVYRRWILVLQDVPQLAVTNLLVMDMQVKGPRLTPLVLVYHRSSN